MVDHLAVNLPGLLQCSPDVAMRQVYIYESIATMPDNRIPSRVQRSELSLSVVTTPELACFGVSADLFEAFNALKSELAQSDKGISYGVTTVVDFGERNQNPSYITNELKETIRRRIARYSAEQYNEWLIRHPEEAAILDGQ
jgi:hypothetical protein